ncbi:MAG: discoidin domain-containing protein [Fibromonadaceae bacterium]|jgi:hypothetical protein|nr:discoidin domain-containing protein [Fibromonadaceae bacterium]
MRTYSFFLAIFLAVCAAYAQDILVNEVGYEQSGPKRAIIQSSGSITDSKASLVNSQGSTVLEINLGPQTSVSGWGGRNFKVVDFSNFEQSGTYKLKVGSRESQSFKIGEKILQAETGAFQVSFFNGMRNTSDGDRNLKVYGTSLYHNMYGGWNDAAGDEGKHISHLSFAHYFNPQQIPLVSYALLHANEMQPNTYGASAKAEAAWGTDYLLRALSKDNYFYISVFDNWGQNGYSREICNWFGEDGDRDGKFQSSFRGGGGVSIAALARASKMNVSGDSSSAQYLEGARRAYANLKTNNISYLSNGVENIIDDYAALLAATELYNATQDASYKTDANSRAQSLISRQSDEGWFYSDKKNGANNRPFYHAADEGLPIVALSRYVEICQPDNKQAIRNAIKKNLQWYAKTTYERPNPFEYAKMYGNASSGSNPGSINLALSGTATASRSEGSFTPGKAIDGSTASDSRWSSYQSGAENDNQWIIVDLGSTYKVNKVILNWEAAYGKSYRIEVSTEGSSWTTVANITNNTSAGIKEHSIAPRDARFVRMFGVERGNEYGGFSLYEFEIYGEPSEQQQQPSTPHNARFFMPQTNETGYWWQGENARIASLAAAFIMGAQPADPSGNYWADTLFGMASAQLDWILGKNPFAVTMMYGFGKTNYPQYNSSKPKPNIKGGICNGITAKRGNENDMEWKPYEDYGENAWKNWRWIEQWLPHNAWYLIAISSLSHRIDNPIIPEEDPDPIIVKANVQLGIQINQKGSVLYMSSQKDVVWRIHNLQGKLLFSSNSRETKWNAENFKGTLVVSAFSGSVAESKLFSILQ